MKKLIAFVVLFLVSSCYHEDYTDLTLYKDYLAELTLFFEKTSEDEIISYHIYKYETDGFDQLKYRFKGGYVANTNDNPITQAIVFKGYKQIGLGLDPYHPERIKSFKLIMREVNSKFPNNIPIINIERDIKGEVSVFYNFENKKLEVK